MKLTIHQAAECLDLPVSTVKRWVRQGRIPTLKGGDECIFEENMIQRWAEEHRMIFSPPQADEGRDNKPERESLLGAMKRGGVYYGITGNDTETVLASALDNIEGFSPEQKQVVYDRLLQREQLNSTGIGKGIGIPHPRTPLSEYIKRSMIATCFLERPVDYKAVDGKPVFVLFILLSPSSTSHLQLLSRLSYCLRNDAFGDFLKKKPDEESFFSQIVAFENPLDKKGLS
jgi:PTS system nitrogen regulatory IIA component